MVGRIIMSMQMHEVELDFPGAFWMEGDDFHFTALSLSDKFASEYVMDLLIPRTPNTNITFRHRHTLSNKDNKVIPMFGWAAKSEKVRKQLEGGERLFLRTEFVVPLKTPKGKDLDENIVYAEWVKRSYEEKKPVGISHHFQTRNEDGEAYWGSLLEIAGTPYPADSDCHNTLPQGEVFMNEDEKKKLEKMSANELQAHLEKITLELETATKKLEEKNKELEKLESEKKEAETQAQKEKIELESTKSEADKAVSMLENLSKEYTKLKLRQEKLEADNIYERTKGPLVRKLVELENRPELESFYREQEIEYLKKELEKHNQPQPEVSGLDPVASIRKARQMRLEDNSADPSIEEQLKAMEPTLRAKFKELMESRGVL